MPVQRREIPAPGFVKVSGRSKPMDGEWFVQFRNGLVDEDYRRTPASMRWIHTGCDWDIVAVKRLA